MERAILHSDLNCFYASVEMMLDPALKGKAVAVCGSTEDRHGIVLAKSELAKKAGVKTGMVNWEARQCCRDLITVPPQYDQYLKYSKLTQAIYQRYTDLIEPFGMDECWLDVSGSRRVFGEPMTIAEEIRQTVREELGLTVSIGVSFNKIFAKLGSDMKKPDAITEISEDSYKEKIWPLACSEMIYCGPATTKKLAGYGIHTIGDVAQTDPLFLKRLLGINGLALWSYANGQDQSRVMHRDFVSPVKSIGHGILCLRKVSFISFSCAERLFEKFSLMLPACLDISLIVSFDLISRLSTCSCTCAWKSVAVFSISVLYDLAVVLILVRYVAIVSVCSFIMSAISSVVIIVDSKSCCCSIMMFCFDNRFIRLFQFSSVTIVQVCGVCAFLIISFISLKDAFAKALYGNRSFNERTLRDYEPDILVHSTTLEASSEIIKDGTIKCWNILKQEKEHFEDKPTGSFLGDIDDFSNYVMLSSIDFNNEITVASKQKGYIDTNPNQTYIAGYRFYLDAQALANDGLLLRDGQHIKVKGKIPLDKYMIWYATAEKVGLPFETTPSEFFETSNKAFKEKV